MMGINLISNNSDKAIVTTCLGKGYLSLFRKYTLSSWKEYAAKHNVDIVYFDTILDKRSLMPKRRLSWEKIQAMAHPELRRYKECLWLDTDVWITPHAPSIFELTEYDSFCAVEAFSYPSPNAAQEAQQVLQNVYDEVLGPNKVNYARTPSDFYKTVDIEDEKISRLVQTGVILYKNTESFRKVILDCYDSYDPDRIDLTKTMGGDMAWLSRSLLSNFEPIWLDPKFNADWIIFLGKYYPEIFGANLKAAQAGKTNYKIRGKLLDAMMHFKLCSGRSAALKQIITDNWFIHFCGDSRDMKYADLIGSRYLKQ